MEQLIAPYQAGNPQNRQKWLRCSLGYLSKEFAHLKIKVSPTTIRKWLKERGYSLRVNHKKRESDSNHPERDQQFKQIEKQRQRFYQAGLPVISVDSKKKELIGLYKNAGKIWTKEPFPVKVHDFPSEADGKAIPYGIYDLRYKCGTVYVGDSADTPEFAVEALVLWWEKEGCVRYRGAKELLILADSGGSNSCRARMWKYALQRRLCNQYGISVVVCHYPTGCSKWNPIEHHLFSAISQNWSGQPLTSYEKMLGYIRGTTNKSGLVVRAQRLVGNFAVGKKVSKAEMESLNLEWGNECPRWNYTLRPNQNGSPLLTQAAKG